MTSIRRGSDPACHSVLFFFRFRSIGRCELRTMRTFNVFARSFTALMLRRRARAMRRASMPASANAWSCRSSSGLQARLARSGRRSPGRRDMRHDALSEAWRVDVVHTLTLKVRADGESSRQGVTNVRSLHTLARRRTAHALRADHFVLASAVVELYSGAVCCCWSYGGHIDAGDCVSSVESHTGLPPEVLSLWPFVVIVFCSIPPSTKRFWRFARCLLVFAEACYVGRMFSPH